jgi:hypothetical protein
MISTNSAKSGARRKSGALTPVRRSLMDRRKLSQTEKFLEIKVPIEKP